MANTERSGNEGLHEEWVNLQQQELSDLQKIVRRHHGGGQEINNAELKPILDKILKSFEDYVKKRSHMICLDVSPYFAPPWSSSLENSVLWIGGCRPSSYIRLVYALCGLDIESELGEYLRGEKIGELGELTARQMFLVDQLRRETIAEESKLSEQLAFLQEDIADKPLAAIAKRCDQCCESTNAGETLGKHDMAMATLVQEADVLRLKTNKKLIKVLTPIQAVLFLAASIKLCICMREWGKKSDEEHGRG